MRIHSVVASVAIAAAAVLTTVAAPAQAAPRTPVVPWKASGLKAAADCTIKPASVNMYTEARDVTFDVPSATDQWLLDSTLFGAADPAFYYSDIDFTITPTWTFDPRVYKNSEAGSVLVDVYTGPDLPNNENPDYCQAPFSLKRGAKISAALKVTTGGYRTVSGKVQQSSWGATPKYVVVKGGTVNVQKLLNGAWVTKKTVKTSTTGTYSAKIRAAKGAWRAVYTGTSQIGSRTSAEHTG